MKEIDNPKGMEKLYEGVDASVPMKSAVFGVMSLVLEFFGYFSIAYFVRTFSEVFGIILFVGSTVFAILGSGHHMKYALGVWMFIKGGRDERAYELLSGLYHGGNATKLAYFGYILYVVALMVSVCMGYAVYLYGVWHLQCCQYLLFSHRLNLLEHCIFRQ